MMFQQFQLAKHPIRQVSTGSLGVVHLDFVRPAVATTSLQSNVIRNYSFLSHTEIQTKGTKKCLNTDEDVISFQRKK